MQILLKKKKKTVSEWGIPARNTTIITSARKPRSFRRTGKTTLNTSRSSGGLRTQDSRLTLYPEGMRVALVSVCQFIKKEKEPVPSQAKKECEAGAGEFSYHVKKKRPHFSSYTSSSSSHLIPCLPLDFSPTTDLFHALLTSSHSRCADPRNNLHPTWTPPHLLYSSVLSS